MITRFIQHLQKDHIHVYTAIYYYYAKSLYKPYYAIRVTVFNDICNWASKAGHICTNYTCSENDTFLGMCL